jgi:8-oxo-dGTP diphosphatase
MKQYVLGFIFDQVGSKVLLIKKERPEWQKGRWNGIGGKVEANELPLNAMRRELYEETGLNVNALGHFCTFMGDGYAVHCFKCFCGILDQAESKTDETVMVHEVNSPGYQWMPNLRWLISMALSHHLEENHNGWYQIIERADDQSPAKYLNCQQAFPKILTVQEALND